MIYIFRKEKHVKSLIDFFNFKCVNVKSQMFIKFKTTADTHL